ncbi:Alcohol dehydrogenase [NADP+] [Papilio machaon]|uniref:Alcohol dehydrogenase [NADP+] n=1 Tax=Papilio machaon TaxID=76193 RepID=A0A0N1IPK2_PAPMA|nr:Alcohol dehydrogenase [NADP+] [Papilio machaon]
MPVIGLGTFLGFDENGQKQVKDSEVELPVMWALNSGYRLIDTASLYFNEEQVGRGIHKSSVPRENVFIVTKVLRHHQLTTECLGAYPELGLTSPQSTGPLGLNEQRHVLDALRASLARLNTSYVDLYLIHNPVALKADHSGFDVVDYVDTWRSMEEAKTLGLAKSIGISNFNISQIDRLLDNCHIKPAVLQVEADHSGFDVVDYVDTWRSMEEAKTLGLAKSIGISNFNISQIDRLLDNCHIKPAVLQVEVNLNLAQNKLIEHVKKENITVMAYTPFGGLFSKSQGPPPPRKDHPALVKLANKYGKTTPQIVLRYLVQRGVIPIPKTVHKERVKENIDIFDFELKPEEMKLLGNFFNFK